MRKLVTFLLLVQVSIFSIAQTFSLPTQWKFKTGDLPDYKLKDFPDQDWQILNLPEYWEKQGINYDGYAWYRVQFDIPQNLLHTNSMLELGKIDDSDETYFNGELIGKTGKFPPNDQSAWDLSRTYFIPKKLVQEHNTIAIKVYDGTGNGGLYFGKMLISSASLFEKTRKEQLKNNNSYHQLTTSNGLIAAIYNAERNEVEQVYPHIFSAIDSSTFVNPYVSGLKINVNQKPKICYKENTHVIELQFDTFKLSYFASFTKENKVFYGVLEGDKSTIDKVVFNITPDKTLDFTQNQLYRKYVAFAYDKAAKNLLESTDFDLIDREIGFMKNIFSTCKFPEELTTEERNLIEQSISVLKMSQVSDKEIYPYSHGQILASLRPGVWSISWVRDAAYSIMAMSEIGMYNEAKKGLEFMLKAPSNRFRNYIHTDHLDYGPGIDYQISLTRYFGNGTEECDFNQDGPNIEYDDWGLFLIALHDYVTQSNDWTFFNQWLPVIQNKIAEPIIFITQENGLLKRDSGPWEHHLPGKQFTYTNVVNSVGLKLFSELLEKNNLPSERYAHQAEIIKQAVLDNLLIDNTYFKGNFQETKTTDHHYFDGATFDLFAFDLIQDKKLFQSHLEVYNPILKVKGKNRGYIRFKSESSYENQEWPMASMRVAVAQKKYGKASEAKNLINGVTKLAAKNYNLIPEILTVGDLQYSGAIPMVGYGSGAYILAVLEYYQ